MRASHRPRHTYPRALISWLEARRRIKRALGCDDDEALGWLKGKVRLISIGAYKGNFRAAYHEDDASDAAMNAWRHLERMISFNDVDEDKELDWSNVSIDEADLEKALAQEHLDPNEPIKAGPPPEPCVVFAVAVERVRKASGYSEAAATGYLKDQLFGQRCILAWTRPTRRTLTWQEATDASDMSLVYVMTEALKQALAVDFPRAENFETSKSGAVSSFERDPSDPESLCLKWLEGEMRKSPERSPKAKRDWQTDAQQLFPGLSGRCFEDRVWPRALKKAGASWDRPGPKSSR